jgi:putative ABC transport system permease protein
LVNKSLLKVDEIENSRIKDGRITTSLIPLTSIFLGEDLHNEIGHSLPKSLLWVVIALATIAILTACFNYTNLSIARSLRRSREVGVRKVVGAQKSQVMTQFIVESVFISLVSLVLAFVVFFLLRSAFLSLGPSFATLQLSPGVLISSVILACVVGVIAGLLPAVSLSGINPLLALKNAHSLKLLRHVSLRKVLIFTQYTCSLFFMAVTIIIYKQYDYLISQDLGFQTKDIVNISVPDNKVSILKEVISQMPESKQISQSQMVSALGSGYSTYTKFSDPLDSIITDQNSVDENYLPLHQYKLLAGRNFLPALNHASTNEIVVNEKLIKYFNLGNGSPEKTIGLSLSSNGKQYVIVGVVQDFHYNSLYSQIRPTLIKYAPDDAKYLNIKVNPGQVASLLGKVNKVWKNIDPVHPLIATNYQDDIKDFYQPLSFISKIIGSLAFLTVLIASMGLFGMVVFTVETRIKEVSVRKVLGASELSIVYILSKGFLSMLSLAAILVLIISSLLFNKLITMVAYHASLPLLNMISCTIIFLLVALLLICSQTLRAARSNPAKILKAQ